MPKVVSNTGPILALARIGQFNLLQFLFGTIVIPQAVRAEVKDEISLAALTTADWITIRSVQDALAVELLREELDAGDGTSS